MPLGDSITQGDDNHNTYRRPLWQKLKQAGFDVDFVGTFNTQFGGGKPPNPDFDLDHQGEWGREAWAVLPKVEGYARETQPDIVLLHLGTNDIRSNTRTVPQAIQTLGEIIDTLRKVRPSVTVLLATIIPTGDSTGPAIQALVAEIPKLAAAKDTVQSRVILVDQNAGFDARNDLYDGVHPNPAGEEKLAQKWFAALSPILSGNPRPTSPLLSEVVNGASFVTGPLSPGMIATVRGSLLGPATPAGLIVNSAGVAESRVADTRVLFDGIPAPVIYTSTSQINVIVPYTVTGSSTRVEVEYKDVRSNALTVPVASAAPAVFTADSTGKGPGALLNSDSSLNTSSAPAAKGSVVVMYLTGEGNTAPAGLAGKVASDGNWPKPLLPVTVTIGGQTADILYAGAAPNYISGLMQINARVPTSAPAGSVIPVTVKVGDFSSQAGVTLAVRD